ncbi:RNA polymerase factor sigma-54 [Psychrobacter pygoscelis]|uniref:RNA polymerase factor sigma-54 n=1 Tax=Psychrobacter pygoscelis TaxID=2488563 RepID=UPI00103FFD57|nr:RNA polymerase factor sigma-54 [Psychrobacter pygoscelis]
MSISFGLGAKLSTSQKLTPQMQQAIKLLQMSSLELAQEVQVKLDNNPLLERVETSEDALDLSDSLDDTAQEPSATASVLEAQQNIDLWNNTASKSSRQLETSSFDSSEIVDSADKLKQATIDDSVVDSSVHTAWEDSYSYEPTGLSRPSYDDLDDYQGSTSASIQDHVRWQLNFKHLSQMDILIAEYLVDAMDEMGFVQLDLEELQRSLATMASFYQWEAEVQLEEIEAVLRIIQSCDPLGVGARSLTECLQLQLNKLPAHTPDLSYAKALLSAPHYLVSNNIKALMEETGLKQNQIQPALALIRTLNPSPGLAFVNSQPDFTSDNKSYDIPDVLVTADSINEQTVQWQVQLNPETLPKLRVNKEYASLVKRGDDSPDNLYLREHLTDARLFIRSIEERNQNLLKVSTCIVSRQQAFLLNGATEMQPLILKDVADEVGLHESTVSRLTTSKSILTPQGLYSLKYFFSSHVSSSSGEVSSTAISAMIAQMIEAEDAKKPLSDSAIKQRLAEDGIEIARRTVAKYREAMNIGSSTQRKQKY